MAELKIASMNVRGIGNNNKRRETFNWLRNNYQLSFYKWYTVRRQLLIRGDLNRAIKRSLVAFQEAQQAFVFSLPTILNLIF